MKCSDASLLRGDPLLGTAPPSPLWLLIEQDAAWGPDAFDSLAGSPADKKALGAALARRKARFMLIRRAGARPHDRSESHAWCLVDVRSRSLTWGSLPEGRLTPAVAALDGAATGGAPVPLTSTPGLLLVCTHGRHDVCCAMKGRPVARALSTVWPDRTWECSHTGGDRFAANLVMLPDGVLYGRVTAETAVDVVAAHHAGTPRVAHLRGVVGRAPQVQAALVAVADRLSVLPWDSGRLHAGLTRLQHDWRVAITLDGRPAATVHGHDEHSPPRLYTCADLHPTRMSTPVVDAMSVTGSPGINGSAGGHNETG